MRTISRIIVSFLLVLTFNGTALPWGNSPTHFSICYEAVSTPGVDGLIQDQELFVRACSCPDIAQTALFQIMDLGYVDSKEFAKCVRKVAEHYSSWRPDWLDMALGFGAHVAADSPIHEAMKDLSQRTHTLIEVAVDTIIFYDFEYPNWTLGWEQVNIGKEWCNPWLIYFASICYKEKHPEAKRAYPWLVCSAIEGLRSTINLEYGYINAKHGTELSEWYLEQLKQQGVEAASWQKYYDEAVNAVIDLITPNP